MTAMSNESTCVTSVWKSISGAPTPSTRCCPCKSYPTHRLISTQQIDPGDAVALDREAESRNRFCSAVSSADKEGRPRFSPETFFVVGGSMSAWAGNIWRMRLRAGKKSRKKSQWEINSDRSVGALEIVTGQSPAI